MFDKFPPGQHPHINTAMAANSFKLKAFMRAKEAAGIIRN